MHVMLDIETMGTSPDAPIVSIGACRFDEKGVDVFDTFYRKISLKSAMQSGAEMDADTVVWWIGQADEARKEAVSGEADIAEVLGWFASWLDEIELEGLWGNGVGFDNTLLAQSYRRLGQDAPWGFWLDRCYRTVKSMSKVEMERVGTHHNALDDAISQAKHLIEIWKS